MACQRVCWPSRIGNSQVHAADILVAALIWVTLSYLEACFYENMNTRRSSKIRRSSVIQAVDRLRAGGLQTEEKPLRIPSWWDFVADYLIRRRKLKKSF